MDSYGIIYTGPPYGENEVGCLVDTYATEEQARLASRKLNNQPGYYGSIRIVDLDDSCKHGYSYRELGRRQMSSPAK